MVGYPAVYCERRTHQFDVQLGHAFTKQTSHFEASFRRAFANELGSYQRSFLYDRNRPRPEFHATKAKARYRCTPEIEKHIVKDCKASAEVSGHGKLHRFPQFQRQAQKQVQRFGIFPLQTSY